MTNNQTPLIYVGAAKSGSTWLFQFLKSHPQMCTACSKEIFYFDRYFERGLTWYLNQFPSLNTEHRYLCDISHDYMFSAEAIKRIRETFPEKVRILAFLRNPADRTFSSYLFSQRNGLTDLTFRDRLKHNWDAIAKGASYSSAAACLLAHFRKEELKFMLYEKLEESPEAFLDDLTEWLDINTIDNFEPGRRVLPASKARSRLASRTAKKLARPLRDLGLNRTIMKIKSSKLISKLLYQEYKSTEKPQIDSEDRAYLVASFTDEVIKLNQLLPELELTKYWPEYFYRT